MVSTSEMLRGDDIFHDRKRFVPGGPGSAALWFALAVPAPSLDDCISFCRRLKNSPYDGETIGKVLDVYRYMERRIENVERPQKEKLRGLPLVCSGIWKVERPIFLVEDAELREQLAAAEPSLRFWTPPCDIRELSGLIPMIGLTRTAPTLEVTDDRNAAHDQGESMRSRFERAVDHLSDELARNDIGARQKLCTGWPGLREMPLYVYDDPLAVTVTDTVIAANAIRVHLKALLLPSPLALHIWHGALSEREHGGRAIASLFPPEVRRRIEAEWVVAWLAGNIAPATGVHLASDEAYLEALKEEAAKIEATPKTPIKISAPADRKKRAAEPRTLKDSIGIIGSAMVVVGSTPVIGDANKPKLNPTAPNGDGGSTGSGGGSGGGPRPRTFDQPDVEQVGWAVVSHVLNGYQDKELVDFRKRHGVGADGAFDWTRFVELKATAGGPPSTIEMTQTEYERAKQAGMDYILAIVSGLETGQTCQVRLIFDPINRASHKPTAGVRFHSLNDVTSIVVSFDEGKRVGSPIQSSPLDGLEVSIADSLLHGHDDQVKQQPDSGRVDLTQVSAISFFITQAQKQALRERGFPDEKIRNMTPAEAHKLLDLSS